MLACWRALLANERNEGLRCLRSWSRQRFARSGYAVILANNLSPCTLLIAYIGGQLNPTIDHMPAESWGFVVDGLRDRASTRNMTLDELGSELVSFWADRRMPRIRPSAPLGKEFQEQQAVSTDALRLRYLSFHDLLNETGIGENAR